MNFSDEPSARPPDMTILADVSSGRSDKAMASESDDDTPGFGVAETVSTLAEPSSFAALKEAVRPLRIARYPMP